MANTRSPHQQVLEVGRYVVEFDSDLNTTVSDDGLPIGEGRISEDWELPYWHCLHQTGLWSVPPEVVAVLQAVMVWDEDEACWHMPVVETRRSRRAA